jgi:hypothetical protein
VYVQTITRVYPKVAQVPTAVPKRYWLQLTVVIACLQGCAVPVGQIAYNGVSAVSIAATGKGLPEHGASVATGADCSIYNYLFKDKDYICEEQDYSRTYNRNAF